MRYRIIYLFFGCLLFFVLLCICSCGVKRLAVSQQLVSLERDSVLEQTIQTQMQQSSQLEQHIEEQENEATQIVRYTFDSTTTLQDIRTHQAKVIEAVIIERTKENKQQSFLVQQANQKQDHNSTQKSITHQREQREDLVVNKVERPRNYGWIGTLAIFGLLGYFAYKVLKFL